MSFLTGKSRVVALVAVPVLVVGGWAVLKPDHKAATTTNKPTTTSTTTGTSGTSTTALIDTVDYKYVIPAGWLQIDKDALDKAGADSVIARVSSASAVFKTTVSSSTPKDDAELKNNALNDIKKNAPHFVLISSVATKVDSKPGQVFTYSFTDSDGKNKIRQQLSAIPNKGKTFFLLATSLDSDFDKQTGDFNSILAGFKFK
jgi:hypothetical protein